jgi:hypothetical protein
MAAGTGGVIDGDGSAPAGAGSAFHDGGTTVEPAR